MRPSVRTVGLTPLLPSRFIAPPARQGKASWQSSSGAAVAGVADAPSAGAPSATGAPSSSSTPQPMSYDTTVVRHLQVSYDATVVRHLQVSYGGLPITLIGLTRLVHFPRGGWFDRAGWAVGWVSGESARAGRS